MSESSDFVSANRLTDLHLYSLVVKKDSLIFQQIDNGSVLVIQHHTHTKPNG